MPQEHPFEILTVLSSAERHLLALDASCQNPLVANTGEQEKRKMPTLPTGLRLPFSDAAPGRTPRKTFLHEACISILLPQCSCVFCYKLGLQCSSCVEE